MANTVIIVDEERFDTLQKTIDSLTKKVEKLCAKETSGLKDKWLVSDEVCNILNIGTRKLQDLRTNKAIEFTKSGNKIYYKASAVEAYLENCTKSNSTNI